MLTIIDGLVLECKQWGSNDIPSTTNVTTITLPISVTKKLAIIALDKVSTNNPVPFGYYLNEDSNNKIIKFITEKNTSSGTNNSFSWFGIFK